MKGDKNGWTANVIGPQKSDSASRIFDLPVLGFPINKFTLRQSAISRLRIDLKFWISIFEMKFSIIRLLCPKITAILLLIKQWCETFSHPPIIFTFARLFSSPIQLTKTALQRTGRYGFQFVCLHGIFSRRYHALFSSSAEIQMASPAHQQLCLLYVLYPRLYSHPHLYHRYRLFCRHPDW